jgi:hypothetical protein
MTTGRTPNLNLALPVQGELSGSWGDEVNNGITDYIDIAVAGTLTLTGDGAVTLANTTGAAAGDNIGSTTAQYYILKVVGPLTATKVITGPSSSKTYIVNNTDSTYGVTIKASGQTGVTVAAGQRALVVFNGTDYVQVGASAGGSNTQVQYNNSGALAGSANFTFDGTNVQIGSQGDLRLGDSDNSNYVALQAPATVASNVTFTLPSADGTSGQTVTTNGSGALSFGTLGVAGGGTGLTTTTAYSVVFSGTTSTGAFQASAGPGTSGHVLTSNGAGALPTFQALPASGVSKGQSIAFAMIFGL